MGAKSMKRKANIGPSIPGLGGDVFWLINQPPPTYGPTVDGSEIWLTTWDDNETL